MTSMNEEALAVLLVSKAAFVHGRIEHSEAGTYKDSLVVGWSLLLLLLLRCYQVLVEEVGVEKVFLEVLEVDVSNKAE